MYKKIVIMLLGFYGSNLQTSEFSNKSRTNSLQNFIKKEQEYIRLIYDNPSGEISSIEKYFILKASLINLNFNITKIDNLWSINDRMGLKVHEIAFHLTRLQYIVNSLKEYDEIEVELHEIELYPTIEGLSSFDETHKTKETDVDQRIKHLQKEMQTHLTTLQEALFHQGSKLETDSSLDNKELEQYL